MDERKRLRDRLQGHNLTFVWLINGCDVSLYDYQREAVSKMEIDNYIKIVRGFKYYGRYMDDSYVIYDSKEVLEELLQEIIEIASRNGITVNTRKTRICKFSDYWRFLQIQYSLTETGRVIQKIHPKRLTAMRRKMKKVASKMTKFEFWCFYHAWFKSHYKTMSKRQRENLDKLYRQLLHPA